MNNSWFEQLAVGSLLALSSLLGIDSLKPELSKDWNYVEKEWIPYQSGVYTTLKSTTIGQICEENSTSFLQFPSIIHGAHQVFIDGQMVVKFGDPTFNTVRSFFGAPAVSCQQLAGASEVTWKVFSYTRYFARITTPPKIYDSHPNLLTFNETFSVVAAGSLLLISIFSFITSFGKVPLRLAMSLCLSNIALAAYFFFGSAAAFGLEISMLWAHKLADIGVWIGLSLFMHTLVVARIIPKKLFYFFLSVVAPATLIVAFGQTGDQIQFGTSMPFGLTLAALVYGLMNQIKLAIKNKNDRLYLLRSLGLAFWTLSVVNDILVVTGLFHGYVFLTFGTVGGLFFFALALSERIQKTYRERDHLRENLELEVEKKTFELRNTQAELIQSAKLASLGTLSAGIAHEINNSLNYVNGALRPIEKVCEKEHLTPEARTKLDRLFPVMRDGLNLTFEIIQSLKNYTGLNQAKINDILLVDVFQSVLKILKNRLMDNIQVKIDVDPTLKVFASVVGLNQMLMNLMGNAIDAMPEGGTLTLSGQRDLDGVKIQVSDTGQGMSSEVQDRIFEPFFTTKDVGSGTGLGLHIVKMEIERHRGEVKISSEVGHGTTFEIFIPNQKEQDPGLEESVA